jgi:hypothetical protein
VIVINLETRSYTWSQRCAIRERGCLRRNSVTEMPNLLKKLPKIAGQKKRGVKIGVVWVRKVLAVIMKRFLRSPFLGCVTPPRFQMCMHRENPMFRRSLRAPRYANVGKKRNNVHAEVRRIW